MKKFLHNLELNLLYAGFQFTAWGFIVLAKNAAKHGRVDDAHNYLAQAAESVVYAAILKMEMI